MSEAPATRFEPIAISGESTVVAEFTPDPSTADAYQSEAALEREFIRLPWVESHLDYQQNG